MHIRDTLICTAGASLLYNRNAPFEAEDNKIEIAKKLKELSPMERACGAEINSNQSIFENDYLEEFENLYLLVSDTEVGTKIGEILNLYYQDKFKQITIKRIEGLQDKDYQEFKLNGLKNLVKSIGEIVQNEIGSGVASQKIALNATGGFKAQIFSAGLTGQVLGIPVFYMYEGFPKVIELPPMPVDFDYELWIQHFALIQELYEQELIAKEELEENYAHIDPRIRVLIDQDDDYYYFNTVGIIYHEAFYINFMQNKHKQLPPKAKKRKSLEKAITYEDQNYGKHRGLRRYLEKIYLEKDYIKSIYTFTYNPGLPTKNKFKPDSKGNIDKIEGLYSIDGKTTEFGIYTTASSKAEQDAVCIDLSNEYL